MKRISRNSALFSFAFHIILKQLGILLLEVTLWCESIAASGAWHDICTTSPALYMPGTALGMIVIVIFMVHQKKYFKD